MTICCDYYSYTKYPDKDKLSIIVKAQQKKNTAFPQMVNDG